MKSVTGESRAKRNTGDLQLLPDYSHISSTDAFLERRYMLCHLLKLRAAKTDNIQARRASVIW
jgi:hypothetical protein